MGRTKVVYNRLYITGGQTQDRHPTSSFMPCAKRQKGTKLSPCWPQPRGVDEDTGEFYDTAERLAEESWECAELE